MGGAGGGNGGSGGTGGAGGGGPLTVAQCYDGVFVNGAGVGPNYDQFNPIIGSHCLGTNHQDITGVERVVYLGDSVTVGTPPTPIGGDYRSQLADKLAQKFGIAAPNLLWKTVDLVNGKTLVEESGAFASCSKWGARTDDFLMGGAQIADCFGMDKLGKKTLVVMTMGGNDIASLTKDASNGVPQADLWNKAQTFVQYMRDAMAWFYTPGRFPKGVYVVFANNYEFTDGTANVQTCDVSGLAGFDKPVPSPEQLKAIVVWINEQYMQIATEFHTDMIFLLEEFCGHGFENDNPQAPCYRGPGTPRWFDLTCIHPNPDGHDHLPDIFMAVVNELTKGKGLEMSQLVNVAEGLHCAESEIKMPGGVRMNTRMTVLRLGNGKLLVHSPIRLDEALAKSIDALGEVAYIVAPNCMHHLFFGPCAERHKNAKTFGPPGLAEKVPSLRIDEVLTDTAPSVWADELEQLVVQGAPKMSEVVLFHKPTRTLIVSDLFFNIVHPANFMTKVLTTFTGTRGKLAKSRIWSVLMNDKTAFEASVRKVLAWDFDRLVMAHGEIVEKNAGEKARAVMGL